MQSESVKPFSDNWSYLRAELSWLDRVLTLAIANQRRETKEVDRLAKTRADRVSSHWWKGFVSLEGDAAYDSPMELSRRRLAQGDTLKEAPAPKLSYQQQMDARIRLTQQRGIRLALPLLCDRLQLTLFEKNVLLLGLAPEVSRRYGRIYRYLNDVEQPGTSDLPTVDLSLRLFCRSDAEWRTARSCFLQTAPLIQHHLVELHAAQTEALLNHSLKLSEALVAFLLAERSDTEALEALLPLPTASTSVESVPPPSRWLTYYPPDRANSDPWASLILPAPLRTTLQQLCHRAQAATSLSTIAPTQSHTRTGALVLAVGAAGTGKTTAALAIAATLNTPLVCVDLAQVDPANYSDLLQDLAEQAPPVLLLQSAHQWISRLTSLADAHAHQFFELRQQCGITLLTMTRSHPIKHFWRSRLNAVLEFPLPDYDSRLQLWQQACQTASLDTDVDWRKLAQHRLTGGEVQAIVREAALYAATQGETTIQMAHLLHVLKQPDFRR